jgi:hypothetical protein
MILLGDDAQVEARFSPFRDSANLTQDRCSVFPKHRTGSEIILEAVDVTTVCAKRTIGLEIIFDTPNDTPR